MSKTIDAAAIKRLPRWAQDHIAALERHNGELEQRLRENSLPPGKIAVRDYMLGDRGLPDRARVRFLVPPRNPLAPLDMSWIEASVDRDDGRLQIMASDTVDIQLQASNVFSVGLAR